MIDQDEGPVRLHLTDRGITCAEEFDADTSAYLRKEREKGPAAKIPFVGTWWGQATALGLAALVGAGATILGTSLLGQHTPAAPHVPLSVSIKSPPYHVPADGYAAFSGSVTGLNAGETVWLFSTQLTDPKGHRIKGGIVLINAGPCDVTGEAWQCPTTRVGGPNVRDEGLYLVWVAVLKPAAARELQNDLVVSKSVYVNHSRPPQTRPGGLTRENVLRK